VVEYWSTGVLEQWSLAGSAIVNRITPILHHSDTPTLPVV
jgi:hypothetical protein